MSGIDIKKIDFFLDVLTTEWEKNNHSKYYVDYFYHFCSDWCANRKDMTKYIEYRNKISSNIYSFSGWNEELINNYKIGYSDETDSILLGISVDDNFVVSVVCDDIVGIACDSKHILLSCENNYYYIINSQTNEVSEKLDYSVFNEKCGLLLGYFPEFIVVSQQGFNQSD